MSPRATLRTAGPALLLGVLAFVLTLDVRAQREISRVSAGRRADLIRIVEAREKRASDLEARLAELRTQVADLAEASGESQLRELRAVTDRIAGLSGLTEATGQGVVVTLADAPSADRGANDPDSRIQDVDVHAVVNTLWEIGAEAIAINGQRLVATSAIRNAGAALLVNFRVLSSPYQIEAIGDGKAMKQRFERTEVARRFSGWADVYGLGFSVQRDGSLELPAYQGSIRFRYARPIEGGD